MNDFFAFDGPRGPQKTVKDFEMSLGPLSFRWGKCPNCKDQSLKIYLGYSHCGACGHEERYKLSRAAMELGKADPEQEKENRAVLQELGWPV